VTSLGGGDEFFGFLFGCWGWGGLFLGVQGSDEEFGFELRKNGFVVVFPELLGGIFTGDAGEDYSR
jgi:hypothetical protein